MAKLQNGKIKAQASDKDAHSPPTSSSLSWQSFFHDVHEDLGLEKELGKNKVLGSVFKEILYEDDTIIYSRNPKTLQKQLHKIQEEGEK